MSLQDIRVKVKMPANYRDAEFVLPESCAIRDLEMKVLQLLETDYNQTDRKIRLIFSGKLLQPDNSTLKSFSVVNGSFIHAVISAGVSVKSTTLNDAPERANNIFMATNNEEQIVPNAFPVIRNPTQNEVLSPFELEQQRAGNIVASITNGNANWESGEDGSPVAGRQWLDFMSGVLMGMLLGVLASFFLWERRVSNSHKAGLFVGMFIQLVANINSTDTKSTTTTVSSEQPTIIESPPIASIVNNAS